MYITVKLDALGYVLIRVVQGRRTWKTWETWKTWRRSVSLWPVTCRAFRVKRSVFIACVSASLQHSWGPTDNTWVAKTGRLGQRRIHGLRVFKPTVGYCMICNALKPGNSCCSSQRSANDILSGSVRRKWIHYFTIIIIAIIMILWWGGRGAFETVFSQGGEGEVILFA